MANRIQLGFTFIDLQKGLAGQKLPTQGPGANIYNRLMHKFRDVVAEIEKEVGREFKTEWTSQDGFRTLRYGIE